MGPGVRGVGGRAHDCGCEIFRLMRSNDEEERKDWVDPSIELGIRPRPRPDSLRMKYQRCWTRTAVHQTLSLSLSSTLAKRRSGA